MRREVHVRFCERLAVRFRGPNSPVRAVLLDEEGRVYLGAVPSKKRVQRICRAISDETGRDKVWQDSKTIVERLNRMLIGWANYFFWGQSAKPTVRSICMPAGGCVGGYATNTKSRSRHTNVFRRRLFTLCTGWSSYHTGPRTFRGRKRESFPRAGCGKSACPVR